MKKQLTPFLTSIAAALLLTACGSNHNAETSESYSYDISNTTLSSDSTSPEDRHVQYVAYLEEYLQNNLLGLIPEIIHADVSLNLPMESESDILVNSEPEGSAAIVLELQDNLTTFSAAELAEAVTKATSITTDNVTISDTDGNLLYSGTDD